MNDIGMCSTTYLFSAQIYNKKMNCANTQQLFLHEKTKKVEFCFVIWEIMIIFAAIS